MAPISARQSVEQILSVIHECFHGAVDSGAFLNAGEGGLLALLRRLSADQASRPAAGTSVATHALHLAFSLEVFMEWIEGVRDKAYDWDASWAQSAVDDGEWAALLTRLEARAGRLEELVGRYAPESPEAAWGAAGVLAHTAFHLGAIQVKIDVLLERDEPTA